MITVILIACGMVAVTVTVHAAGSSLVLRSLMKSRKALPTQTWPIAWLLIRVTWSLILIHLAEVTVWALCYLWGDACPMPSRRSTSPQSLIRRLGTAIWCC